MLLFYESTQTHYMMMRDVTGLNQSSISNASLALEMFRRVVIKSRHEILGGLCA